MKNEGKYKTWIDGAFVVAATTLMGYLIAFAFEFGYFSQFRIGYQFITVTLTSALASALILLLYIGGLALLIDTMKKERADRIIIWAFGGPICIFGGIVSSFPAASLVWKGIAFFIFTNIYFGIALFFFQKMEKKKVDAKKDILDLLIQRTGLFPVILPIVSIVFVFLFGACGAAFASIQNRFDTVQMLNENGKIEDYLVFNKDDRYVLLNFNRDQKLIGNKIRILTEEDVSERGVSITVHDHVGILHVAKE